MKKIRSKYTHPDFQFACFRLEDLLFGVEIKSVKEIIKPKEIIRRDGSPPFIEGVINLRSMEIPVVDLRRKFSLPVASAKLARIIIVSITGRIVGLLVDEVRDIIIGGKEYHNGFDADRKEAWDSCLDSMLETDAKSVRILNLGALFDGEELAFLDSTFSGRWAI